ncbi:MAG: hypothetical protein OHK0048_19790 [Rhodoferax sp.]
MTMFADEDLQLLFSQIPIAISLSRESDGLYVEVNAEWCRMTGYQPEQVLGRTSVDLGLWSNPQQRWDALEALRATGRAYNLAMGLTKPDGRRLELRVNVTRIVLRGENHLLSFLKDVTDEMAAQAALLANAQLLEATNQRLKQQLDLFEALEGLADVGYWMARPEEKSVVWSLGMYRITGTDPKAGPSERRGKNFIHPDDQAAYRQACLERDGRILALRWLSPEGQWRWYRTRIQQLHDAQRTPIVFGVVQDITTERQVALALQSQLDFIQKITSHLPGVVFKLQRDTQGQLRFLFVAETISKLFPGFAPQDLLRDAYCTLGLHHPDDLPGYLDVLNRAFETLQPWEHEFRLCPPDGGTRWILAQGLCEPGPDGTAVMHGYLSDVTERHLANAQLRQSEARFRALTELSSDWYWEQDAQFRFTRIEGNAAGMSDFPDASWLGRTRWDSGAEGVTEAQWAKHRALLEAHQPFKDFQYYRRKADGSVVWASISGAPMFDEQGRFVGYRGVGRDITDRKLAEARIEHLAFYDPLTGLPNRRLLLDRLQAVLAAAQRHPNLSAVLFIDLDNFKDLNDACGHDVGDMLLCQVAQRLQSCVRKADTVARLGGDEFVVLLQDLDPDEVSASLQVERVAQKILSALGQPYMLAGLERHSTPSIGVVLVTAALQSADELFKQVDLAMYQAKAAGRNTVRFFDPSMQTLVAQRARIEQELRHALRGQELVLYYQPVVNTRAEVVGAEALVRWQHPVRGLVGPGEFISVAEQTGLIVPLGQWVIEQACHELVRWAQIPERRGWSLAVNVSVSQFRQADFVAQVLAALRASGADPTRLRIEITESLLLSDTESAIATLQALRAQGLRFSLDDFGTGYSSLAYLKRLPLDVLKIDQGFVRDVLIDPNDAAIAKTVLDLGRSLGLKVVAEGVEEVSQWQFLLQHGCVLFQGYLFSRPVPSSALQHGSLVVTAQPAVDSGDGI